MAELVGGALLSGFLDVLFDRLASQEVLDFFQRKEFMSKLLDELKIRLLSANVLLNDAEEKQLRDQNVKKWLEELKEVLYEADHVVDKIDTEALRRKVEEGHQSEGKVSKFFGSISNFFSAFDNTVKSEIEKILRRIMLLVDQKDMLGLKEGIQNNCSQRLLAPLVEENDVYGREADKEAIVELLLNDDVSGDRISVIPIVGKGGLGKTTLAQLVYRDSRVKEHFDLKVWLTVAEVFDVLKLTKMIFEAVTSRKCDIEDLYQLQDELKEALMGKKFLFVHDDVWNENYELWDILKSPFESGAKGSMIIVTTRSKIVASKMGNVPDYELQLISDDDCWNLFAKHVGFNKINSGAHSELKEIGVGILKKCKGVPLAVKSIAGLLRSAWHPEEWRKILESEIWELENNNILPALWLSYKFLPLQLKRCFSYCSIFPKDHEFLDGGEGLILLWMAEGLLQPKTGKRIEDVGEEYLEALVSRSFLQRQAFYSWGLKITMHDLMHDLATCVSGEFSFISYHYSGMHRLTSKARHLSYTNKVEDLIKLENLSEVNCFRTLLALGDYLGSTFMQKVVNKVVLKGGYLRALSIRGFYVEVVPGSIENLKHLRYLDLSSTNIKEIPSSVCMLYNLQTLKLYDCKMLTRLPTNICNLINLRHLKNESTPLKAMPPQMCNMRNLQTLSEFILGENDGFRIKELGELHLLHGSLSILWLQNVTNIEDASQADLKNKKYLRELALRWGRSKTDDSTKERELLDALQPHTNLMKLRIYGFRGTVFPNWVAHESYRNIIDVHLFECANCCVLPPFGQLPSLQKLAIVGFDTLESIGDEFCGTSLTKPFSSLKILIIRQMRSLEEWSFNRADLEGGIFPNLEHLNLGMCKNLTVGLPVGHLPSLRSVEISNCDDMVALFPTSLVHIDTLYPSLESLKVRVCLRLESFSGMGLPCNLRKLEVSYSQRLIAKRMSWKLQRLSSLQRLYLDEFKFEEATDSFPEEGLLPSNLTSFSISGFRKLKGLNGKGFEHLTSLQQLSIWSCYELQCLPDEGLALSLTHLKINYCPLITRRCQRGTGEDWPKIQHIPNITINSKEI